jgi:hypothetical protein
VTYTHNLGTHSTLTFCIIFCGPTWPVDTRTYFSIVVSRAIGIEKMSEGSFISSSDDSEEEYTAPVKGRAGVDDDDDGKLVERGSLNVID